jgi:pentatricopeptide repeat-containing protein PET309
MTVRHKSGDWTGVEQFWDLALSVAKQQGAPLRSLNVPSSSDVSSADGLKISSLNIKAPTIMPIHQLDLTRCLSVYMNALAAEGKAGLISAVVDGLLQDGFLLDNKNWNQYIQILAQHRYYELAFRLCEDKLMDNWTGWATIRWRQPGRNRLPIELRNKRKQSLHLRPNTHTFLYLSRAYLDLQDMATESRLSEERLDIILKTCSRTIQAINTMERTDSSLEREILRDP